VNQKIILQLGLNKSSLIKSDDFLVELINGRSSRKVKVAISF
jgi:hypothetical protein